VPDVAPSMATKSSLLKVVAAVVMSLIRVVAMA